MSQNILVSLRLCLAINKLNKLWLSNHFEQLFPVATFRPFSFPSL